MQSQPERYELRTRDQDTAVGVINTLAEHQARVTVADPAAVDFLVRSASFAEWGLDRVQVGGVRYAAAAAPIPFLLAGVYTAGSVTLSEPGGEITFRAGDSFLYPLDTTFHCEYDDSDLRFLRIPPAYAGDLAEEGTGLPADELRFLSREPVSARLGAQWAATVRYLAGQLHTPGLDIPPLLAQEMLRMATAALLRTFPNTTMTAARVPAGGSAGPGVVRRAVDYVDANAGRPLSVTEIAAASGVGAQTLLGAFRRYLDATPLEYLRRVRLERARGDLLAGSDVTVAEVARRWGFIDPGRLAAAYRVASGLMPGELRRT